MENHEEAMTFMADDGTMMLIWSTYQAILARGSPRRHPDDRTRLSCRVRVDCHRPYTVSLDECWEDGGAVCCKLTLKDSTTWDAFTYRVHRMERGADLTVMRDLIRVYTDDSDDPAVILRLTPPMRHGARVAEGGQREKGKDDGKVRTGQDDDEGD